MGPRFDPAVVEVLEAFGRRLASGSDEAVPAREVLKSTSLEPDGTRKVSRVGVRPPERTR
jgi:hypothetical protein